MLTPLAEAQGSALALPLGREALALFPELVADLRARSGIDPGFVRSGVLRVATTEVQADVLRARASLLAGDDVAWLDAAAVRAREPALAADGLGASWSPTEAQIDAAQLTAAYARGAQTLGARIEQHTAVTALLREGARVTGVGTARGNWSAAWVVLATGPWTGRAAGSLGGDASPPIEPVRGQIVTLRPRRPLLRAIAWDDSIYLVPRPDGRLLAGATEEHVGFDCRVTAGGVRSLVAAAIARVPALADAAFAGADVGLRPGSPDGQPFVGPAPGHEGLVLAAGHHRRGILLSALTGRLVADLLAGRPLPDAARAFDPGRALRGGDSDARVDAACDGAGTR
jgi:glycine oxidase